MESRRSLVDEKRKAKRAFVLITGSIALLLFLVFIGVGSSAKIAIFVSNFIHPNQTSPSDDKTPPGPPRVNALSRYTQADNLTISGFAEANSKVKIYDNDKSIAEGNTTDDSKFSIQTKLNKGDNRIYVTATDSSGNEGEQSVALNTTYDPDPPTLDISSPKDNEEVDTKNVVIKGKTEVGASISSGDRSGVVEDDGSFALKYTLTEGSNTITITAVDLSGNKTEKTLTVTYTP